MGTSRLNNIFTQRIAFKFSAVFLFVFFVMVGECYSASCYYPLYSGSDVLTCKKTDDCPKSYSGIETYTSGITLFVTQFTGAGNYGCVGGHCSMGNSGTVKVCEINMRDNPEEKCQLFPELEGCEKPKGEEDYAAADSACRANGGVSHYTVSTDKKSATGYCDMCQTDAEGRPQNAVAKEEINKARWNCCQNNGYIPDNKIVCKNFDLAAQNEIYVNGVNYNPPSLSWTCDLGVPMDMGTMMPQGCSDVENPGGAGGGSGSEGDTSAGIGTDSASQGDWEYNYYPILDSIRDTLNQMLDVVRMGVKALQEMDNGGDTIINNIEVPRDTVINNIHVSSPDVILDTTFFKTQLNAIDTILISTRLWLDAYDSSRENQWVAVCGDKKSCPNIDSLRASIQGYQDSVLEWIARGDSERVVFVDSLFKQFSYIGYGQDTIKSYMAAWDSAISTGIDTAGLGTGAEDTIAKYFFATKYTQQYRDSLARAWGVDSLGAMWDSSYGFGMCLGDSCPPCITEDCFGYGDGNGDSIVLDFSDSLQRHVKAMEDSLPMKWTMWFDSARKYTYFGSFDSTFYSSIGAKIPNSNTCPEQCFQQEINGTYANVMYNMSLDWKLCRPIAPDVLNNLNAFDILKLLARLLTVVSCLYIVMWEVSSKRGRIGL